MKTLNTLLFLAALVPANLALAQSSNAELTITKKVLEKDGTYSSETIVKKGKAAESFNIDQYLKENKADNVSLEISLEGGDEERNITYRGVNAPGYGGDFWARDVETIVRDVNEDVERAVRNIDVNVNQVWDNYGNWNSNDQAFLGVVQTSSRKSLDKGVVVNISDNSAAEKAGLKNGDVLLKLEDDEINAWGDIVKFMNKAKKGDEVKITYSRDGKTETANAVLTNRFDTYRSACNNNQQMVKKAFLGVSEFGDVEDEPGVRVSTTKNSAAEKAGLKKGDVLLELNGKEVNDFDDIEDIIDELKPDDKLKIKYKRDGKTETIEAKLGEREVWDWGQVDWENEEINICEKRACLGICNNDAATGDRRGAAIIGMDCGSPAKTAGLRCGDIIVEVDGETVTNSEDLMEVLMGLSPNTTIDIAYIRNDEQLVASATLQACEQTFDRVTLSDVDETGNGSERTFYAWDIDEDKPNWTERPVIPIHRPSNSDVPVIDVLDGTESNPEPSARSLQLERFAVLPGNDTGHMIIDFYASAKPTLVQIFDMNGRQLFYEELNAFDGLYYQEFDLLEMSQSHVLIRITQEDKSIMEKVFVD